MLELLKTKTVKLAIGAILATIGAYLSDKIGMVEAIKLVVEGMLAMTVRHAIAKGR